MTKEELIERAKRHLNLPDAEIEIAACIMVAGNELADEVMNDAYMRALLQQTYSVPLDGNGQGDLLAATGSITGVAGEILIDGVRSGVVLDNDGNQLQPLLHYNDFLRPQPAVYGYYCVKDRDKILTRAIGQQVNAPSDVVGASGPLTITASYAPEAVTSFPPELDDKLVRKLVDVVSRTIANANPA